MNHKRPLRKKMWDVCTHAVEEFFSMGKYLVLGALIAAAVQKRSYKTSTLLAIGQGPFSSPAVMMGLAYIYHFVQKQMRLLLHHSKVLLFQQHHLSRSSYMDRWWILKICL